MTATPRRKIARSCSGDKCTEIRKKSREGSRITNAMLQAGLDESNEDARQKWVADHPGAYPLHEVDEAVSDGSERSCNVCGY